jgi:DUF4097 and DUF4098 domain-containing protein YvlB
MNASISPTIKIVVLVIFAIIFATTLVALSIRSPRESGGWEGHSRYDEQTKKYDESFKVSNGGTLRLDTDIGDVTITGADVATVQVTVNVRGAERDIKDFAVKFNQNEQGVDVRGRYRDGDNWHFDWNDFDVHYNIVVPTEYNVRIETSGGDIVVTTLTGAVKGNTSGGDLEITTVNGDVNVETSGGDIRLKGVTGTLVTETSGGDIDGSALHGDVRVETSGGDIDLRDVHGRTVASTSGGSVRLELVENNGVDASSSGGDIIIKFPGTATASIHAETSGGSVHCDFPFEGTIDDGLLEGTINGGGNKVRAETSAGDISIRKMN